MAFARDCMLMLVEVLKRSLQRRVRHETREHAKSRLVKYETCPLYGTPFNGGPETLFAAG